MLEGAVDQLTPWFRDWGLLLVLIATFLESSIIIASFVPGESVLLLAGFLSSHNELTGGDPVLSLEFVITVAFVGAFLGDLAGYWIGRKWGHVIIRRFGKYVFLTPERVPVLEAYFTHYGKRAIVLGRFAPFLRSVRTLVAGSARMRFSSFVFPAFFAAGAWATLVAVTGFILGESWRVANRMFGRVGLVVFAVLIALFVWTWRRVRRKVQEQLAVAAGGVLPPESLAEER